MNLRSRKLPRAAFHQFWGSTCHILLASLIKGNAAQYIGKTEHRMLDLHLQRCSVVSSSLQLNSLGPEACKEIRNLLLHDKCVVDTLRWVWRRRACGGGWLPLWWGNQGELYFWWLVDQNQTLTQSRKRKEWVRDIKGWFGADLSRPNQISDFVVMFHLHKLLPSLSLLPSREALLATPDRTCCWGIVSSPLFWRTAGWHGWICNLPWMGTAVQLFCWIDVLGAYTGWSILGA